jgi:hypothetical protein
VRREALRDDQPRCSAVIMVPGRSTALPVAPSDQS